ncbi:hypothetical protein S40288_10702 [Stachybotrys chartarum IBT 40288]|nr:hypothetical protein S40288_10702 [Stachybotrys chartarum IBT 40288]
MSWAAGRETTRTEDTAYCLLGIFGINMPIVYGEGKNAFQRLQREILQRSADVSLLAWNIYPGDRHAGWISKPEISLSHSALRSALRMVCGIEHPWRPRPNWDTPSHDEWWFKIRFPYPERTGCLGSILAPNPAGFRDYRDIAAIHLPDGWSLDTASLSATLPMSEGDEPYMLLPCRPSPDSDILIAVPVKSVGSTYQWLERAVKVPATDAIFMLTIWQGIFALDETGFREATSLAVCERFRQQVVMGVPLPKFLQELQLSNIQLYYFFMSMNFWYHMTRLTSCFVPRWTSLLKRLKVPLGLGFGVVIIGLDLYPRESAALFLKEREQSEQDFDTSDMLKFYGTGNIGDGMAVDLSHTFGGSTWQYEELVVGFE